MSDLRYKSIDELRDIIRKQRAFQEKCLKEASEKLDEAELLTIAADVLRQKANNSNQKTFWARKYLAEKELEQADPNNERDYIR